MDSRPVHIFIGSKGQGMALETVFKILILMVAVLVIVGLILTFSGQIKSQVNSFINQVLGVKQPTSNFPRPPIQKDSFSAKEIANYAETCYATMTAVDPADRTDVTCFILVAKSFESNGILDDIPPAMRNNTIITSTFNTGVVIIDFKDLANEIVIR